MQLYCYQRIINDANGVPWNGKLLEVATGTYYSEAIKIARNVTDDIPCLHTCEGYTALLVLTTAGSLTITFEVSADGLTFYTPYDPDDNNLGAVVTSLTSDRWINFPPRIANYIRFKAVIAGANSTTTLRLLQRTGID